MRKIHILMIVVLFFFVNTASAIGGGDLPGPPPEDWYYWGGIDLPEEGCYNDSGEEWGNSFVGNPSPYVGQEDVIITTNGVQTCVNLTIDVGLCIVNVTFQWLNYSLYWNLWLDWAYAQDWYDEPNISWASQPTWENDSLWFTYYNESELSHSQQICYNNSNVSCYTEGNWETMYSDWRVIANYTCGPTTYNTTCYYWFQPEECSVSYIYPSSPNGTICPCCDSICINATNGLGHPMNLTFYANDTMNETFYIINKYINELNGTYCFCTCGHVDDIFYPLKYNETYHWFVVITDTITSDDNISDLFQFTTVPYPSLCPCGRDAIIELIEYTDKVQDDTWIIGVIMIFFILAIVLGRKNYIKKYGRKK